MGGPLGRHTGKGKWEVRAIMHLTGDSVIFVVKEAEEASLAFVHCVLTLKGIFCRKVLILARLLASFFSASCSKRVTRRIRETKHPLSANANRSVLIAAVSDQGLIILCIHFDFFKVSLSEIGNNSVLITLHDFN